jgi:hypothetical protein
MTVLKNKKLKPSVLIPPDLYAAYLKRYAVEPLGSLDPKNCVFTFEITDKKVEGTNIEILIRCPANLDPDSPARKVVQSLREKPMAQKEEADGYDPEQLIGTKCQVMVVHRSGPGGRLQLAIDAIFPAKPEEAPE